jgi:hypothetical protein
VCIWNIKVKKVTRDRVRENNNLKGSNLKKIFEKLTKLGICSTVRRAVKKIQIFKNFIKTEKVRFSSKIFQVQNVCSQAKAGS